MTQTSRYKQQTSRYKRKQTRENVCAKCLDANCCNYGENVPFLKLAVLIVIYHRFHLPTFVFHLEIATQETVGIFHPFPRNFLRFLTISAREQEGCFKARYYFPGV